ncbi:MAG: N-acetylmuramoyl-L-alanine amidase [Truepera sp.]|nr:N-acetylmuramoyl-L-alanine amidase [Truepera sp.]
MIHTALVVLVSLLAVGFVQPQLRVNGVSVSGLMLDLIPSVSYAPAEGLAGALGSSYLLDRQSGLATFQLAGRILQLRTLNTVEEALVSGDGLRLNGQVLRGPAGIFVGGVLFVPVRPVVEAFGGQVSFVSAESTVVVVLPRASVDLVTVQASAGGERIILRLSGPVPYRVFNRSPNTLQLRLDRTDTTGPQSYSGDSFRRADLLPGGGFSDFRLTLEAGTNYRLFETVAGAGFEIIIDLLPTSGEEALVAAVPVHLVIDAGHGGADTGQIFAGFGSESSLVLAFAKQLRTELVGLGYLAELTRTGDTDLDLTTRSSRGIGADLFVSIHAAEIPRGQYNIYFLEETDAFKRPIPAIQENVDRVTPGLDPGSVRHRILLGLTSNLELGRRYAQALADTLFQSSGYRASPPRAAPLIILAGAGGKGLLLEFNPEDLFSEHLPGALAAALATLASGAF